MSFSLLKFTQVLFKSINLRAELHGKDPIPAADIGFRLVGPNTLLDMFDTGLRHAFYRAVTVEGEDPQPELDGVDPLTTTPELRTTSIDMPVKLIREYLGRNVIIDYGLGGKSNIDLPSCDVNDFKVNMKEGGTVEIDFRVQVAGLDDKVVGKLGVLVKHDVKITVAASAQADGTQEQVPGTTPFKYTVPPEGGIVDTNPAKDATEVFIEANKVTPIDAKAQREAERAAKKTAKPKK